MFVWRLRSGICLLLSDIAAFCDFFFLLSGPWVGTTLSSQIRGRWDLTSQQRLVCVCVCGFSITPPMLVSMGGVTKSYFLSGARTDVPPTAAPPQSQIHLEEESLKNVPYMHFQLKHFPCACIIFSQLPLKKSLSAFNENKQLVPVSPCVMISLWCRHPGDRGSLIFGCFRPNQQPCQIPLAIRSGG